MYLPTKQDQRPAVYSVAPVPASLRSSRPLPRSINSPSALLSRIHSSFPVAKSAALLRSTPSIAAVELARPQGPPDHPQTRTKRSTHPEQIASTPALLNQILGGDTA